MKRKHRETQQTWTFEVEVEEKRPRLCRRCSPKFRAARRCAIQDTRGGAVHGWQGTRVSSPAASVLCRKASRFFRATAHILDRDWRPTETIFGPKALPCLANAAGTPQPRPDLFFLSPPSRPRLLARLRVHVAGDISLTRSDFLMMDRRRRRHIHVWESVPPALPQSPRTKGHLQVASGNRDATLNVVTFLISQTL
jgi:hypothetical protein